MSAPPRAATEPRRPAGRQSPAATAHPAAAPAARAGRGWCLIGEISCLTRQPASATVSLTEPGRIFCIEASRHRR